MHCSVWISLVVFLGNVAINYIDCCSREWEVQSDWLECKSEWDRWCWRWVGENCHSLSRAFCPFAIGERVTDLNDDDDDNNKTIKNRFCFFFFTTEQQNFNSDENKQQRQRKKDGKMNCIKRNFITWTVEAYWKLSKSLRPLDAEDNNQFFWALLRKRNKNFRVKNYRRWRSAIRILERRSFSISTDYRRIFPKKVMNYLFDLLRNKYKLKFTQFDWLIAVDFVSGKRQSYFILGYGGFRDLRINIHLSGVNCRI